jgi:hypothetical protein
MEHNLFTKEENIGFWKNLVLVAIFFTVAPVTLGICLISLSTLKVSEISQKNSQPENIIISPKSGIRVYASLPAKVASINSIVGVGDARPEIIKQYMEYYDSPLAPYSDFIVKTADKYSIDYRLITAIAQQESNICKIIPPGSYNCWGWGITGESTLGFSSYEEGIETVSKGLRENYLNKGYVSIEDIMSKYTPQSNGSWANGVNQFLSAMQ